MKDMFLSRSTQWLCVVPFGLLMMTGCGSSDFKPKLAAVKGVVTMNDKPLPAVTVTFEPQLAGSDTKGMIGGASTGVTDAEGKYELVYNDGRTKGAVVGEHLVRIVSASGGGPAGGAGAVAEVPIPPDYNTSSNMKVKVDPTGNTHDFKIVAEMTQ